MSESRITDHGSRTNVLRQLGQGLLWLVFGAAGAVDRVRRGAARPIEAHQVRRILTMRFGLMGDGVLVGPAIRALRHAYPSARLDVLAAPFQAPIYERSGDSDRVLVWPVDLLLQPRRWARPSTWLVFWPLVRALRAERYDLAVAFYGPLAGLLAFLSGARHRVGFASESYPFLLTHSVRGRRYLQRTHEVEYNLEVARRAGGAPAGPESRRLRFLVRSEERARAEALLARHGVAPGERLVIIHPGATNGSAKRWLLERWGQVADRLIGEQGTRVALVGAPGDRPLAEAVQRAMRERAVDLVGQTATFGELAAVVERCAVLASGDSGPLHLAVALGRPVVAIHGPTDPAISGPSDLSRATVIRKDLPCSPCYDLRRTAECPLGHTLCMKLITVEEVYEAIVALLHCKKDVTRET